VLCGRSSLNACGFEAIADRRAARSLILAQYAKLTKLVAKKSKIVEISVYPPAAEFACVRRSQSIPSSNSRNCAVWYATLFRLVDCGQRSARVQAASRKDTAITVPPHIWIQISTLPRVHETQTTCPKRISWRAVCTSQSVRETSSQIVTPAAIRCAFPAGSPSSEQNIASTVRSASASTLRDANLPSAV